MATQKEAPQQRCLQESRYSDRLYEARKAVLKRLTCSLLYFLPNQQADYEPFATDVSVKCHFTYPVIKFLNIVFHYARYRLQYAIYQQVICY